jgi:hypothetical protein
MQAKREKSLRYTLRLLVGFQFLCQCLESGENDIALFDSSYAELLDAMECCP